MLRFVSHYSCRIQRFSSTKTIGNIDFVENNSFLKIVLNRPKALNSLNLDMIRDLKSSLPTINKNKAFWM